MKETRINSTVRLEESFWTKLQTLLAVRRVTFQDYVEGLIRADFEQAGLQVTSEDGKIIISFNRKP